MKDFVLEAEYFPFFVPEINPKDLPERINSNNNGGVKIVHVTVHPGIEGTDEIERAINNLKNRGHKISFVFLSSVPHERVIEELRDADLSIGKMKMGYYANFQIESMVLGVPAITHIRPEFMTEDLRRSGFIITRLKDLEDTLQYYLTHPEELEKKRKVARNSILRLHNNELLGRRLIELYTKIKSP
jgi:glycosyltransferase involved in cell wall biosynthesis